MKEENGGKSHHMFQFIYQCKNRNKFFKRKGGVGGGKINWGRGKKWKGNKF